MAAKVESDSLPPEIALIELGQELEFALKHPSIDAGGTLRFSAQANYDRDPISRWGAGCARTTGAYWTLPNLAELAALVQKLARELGGGEAGRKPAPRRGA